MFRLPELARTQPIRSWSGLFGGAAGVPGAGPAVAAARGFMDAAASAATGAALPLGDAVARGVDLGYRVIDDYVRRGQQAARSAWSPSGQAAGQRSEAGPADVQRLMERMLQYASDFTSVWFEMLNLATSTAAAARPGNPTPTPTPTAAGAGPFNIGGDVAGAHPKTTSATSPPSPTRAEVPNASTATSDTKVSVELKSRRRTTASVELRGGSAGLALIAHDLRAADAKAPRLRDVRLIPRPAEDRVIVKIRVPDTQPAGAYSGLIVDRDTSLPRGSITVRVER
ncbi:MAG: hypothetical protein ABJA82_02310 [Myxococcales bacterium]